MLLVGYGQAVRETDSLINANATTPNIEAEFAGNVIAWAHGQCPSANQWG